MQVGEGHLRERQPGHYEYIISYRDIFNNRKKKSFGGRDIDELYARAEEFLEREAIKNPDIDMYATIPELLHRRYEKDYAKNFVNEPGYYRNINGLLRIEKSPIGKIPIIDLTEDELETFLCSLTHYSNSVISKTYGQLKLAYREAIADGIVARNLMESANLRCPKSIKADSKVMALTEDEEKRLINMLMTYKPPGNRNNYCKQLLIELYTGMRMGEINALKPENVDFKHGVIHVRSTISMGINNRIYKRDHTKTDAGMRDVPINDLVRPILEEALAEAKKNPEGTIFYDYQKHQVVATMQVCCFYRRICKKCDIPYYGQHSLRHTFATRCIESGIAPIVLKNWLGHTNIHVTIDTYSDVFDRLNNSAMNDFEKYMKNIHG